MKVCTALHSASAPSLFVLLFRTNIHLRKTVVVVYRTKYMFSNTRVYDQIFTAFIIHQVRTAVFYGGDGGPASLCLYDPRKLMFSVCFRPTTFELRRIERHDGHIRDHQG